MERKQIEDFIQSIFLSFSLKLYHESQVTDEYGDTLFSFPDCCKLASNILSTYLNIVTDGDFKCVYSSSAKYSHSWCQSDSLNLVIDITGFQFDDDIYNKPKLSIFHEAKYSDDELRKELAERKFVYTIEEYIKLRCEYFMFPSVIINDTVIQNKEHCLSIDSFFSFLCNNFTSFTKNLDIINY